MSLITSFADKIKNQAALATTDGGDSVGDAQKQESSFSMDLSCSLSSLAFSSPVPLNELTRKEQLLSLSNWQIPAPLPLLEYHPISPPQYSSNAHWLTPIEQLMDAAATNNIDCLTRLIRSGEVPVDVTDSHHFTALMYAATNGHMAIIRRLIDLGATVDYVQPLFNRRDTALHMAAQCGHTRSVELLLKYGHASPMLLNAAGKTAFDLARDFGHGNNKVMKRLFEEAGVSTGSTKEDHQQFSLQAPHPNYRLHSLKTSDFLEFCGNSADFPSLESSLSASSPTLQSQSQFKYHNNNNKRQYNQSRSSNGSNNPDDKQHSLLPNIELLKVFASTGIYRPMLSGTGFSLLTPNGDLLTMLEFARLSLDLPQTTDLKSDENCCWQPLHDGLLAIKRQFEDDLLVKKQAAYLARVKAGEFGQPQQQTGLYQQPKQASSKWAAWSRGGALEKSSIFSSKQEDALEAEMAAYLNWKRSNMQKLDELIDLVKSLLCLKM